ncbi:hypothetical protein JL721_9439 [Aureococcus anophagefferens]|nr:hypothetical protein JL721_9439 [Aureococcus anophagefferens]
MSHSFPAQARFRRHERSAALSLCGTCGDRYQRGAAGPTGMDQSGECDAGGAKHVYVASVAQDAVQDGRSKCHFGACAEPKIHAGASRLGRRPPASRPGSSPKTQWFHLECYFLSTAGAEPSARSPTSPRASASCPPATGRSWGSSSRPTLRARAATPRRTNRRRAATGGTGAAETAAPDVDDALLERLAEMPAPTPAEARAGHWAEDEHAKFLAGLETFGRRWDRVARIVGTRTMSQQYGYDGYDSYDGYGYGHAYASRRASPPALVPEWVWKLGSMLVAAAVVCFGFFLVKNVNELFKTNRRSKARVALPTKPAVEDAKSRQRAERDAQRRRREADARAAAERAAARGGRGAGRGEAHEGRGEGVAPGRDDRAAVRGGDDGAAALARRARRAVRRARRRGPLRPARLALPGRARRAPRAAQAQRGSPGREAAKKRDKKVRTSSRASRGGRARAAAALWSSLRHGDAARRRRAEPRPAGRVNGVYRRSLAGAAPLFRRAPRHDRGVVAS